MRKAERKRETGMRRCGGGVKRKAGKAEVTTASLIKGHGRLGGQLGQ